MRMIGQPILIAAMAAFLGATPALADVKAGFDAWQRGDFAAAVKEWRSLADKGDPDAQFNMGQAYKLGRGAPADMKLAQSWYEKAAAQGHAQAQANLGLLLFQNGNRILALPLIRKAAERGDARAQYVLGTALFNGDGVSRDWPRAYALMSSAASQGLAPARTSLAQMNELVSEADKQKGRQIAQRPAEAPLDMPTLLASKPATRTMPAAKSAPAASVGGLWRVQLGAYGNAAAARGQWPALSRRIPALGGLEPSYEQAGAFTRLRVGTLASRSDAERLCAAARAAGQACFVVAP